MQYTIPENLDTPRLRLRMFKHEDWVRLHEYYADPLCMKYTLGRPLSEAESWRAMASMVGHWQLRGYGPYCLELQATKQVVGICGLWYPNDWPEPEIKWGLVRSHWGQGYAKEAAIAVKQMVARDLADLSLISLIFAENHNSIRLALSLGASLDREIEFRGQLAHIYRHAS